MLCGRPDRQLHVRRYLGATGFGAARPIPGAMGEAAQDYMTQDAGGRLHVLLPQITANGSRLFYATSDDGVTWARKQFAFEPLAQQVRAAVAADHTGFVVWQSASSPAAIQVMELGGGACTLGRTVSVRVVREPSSSESARPPSAAGARPAAARSVRGSGTAGCAARRRSRSARSSTPSAAPSSSSPRPIASPAPSPDSSAPASSRCASRPSEARRGSRSSASRAAASASAAPAAAARAPPGSRAAPIRRLRRQRQGPLPQPRPRLGGHGARHRLDNDGPLRRHPHLRQARPRRRPRLPSQAHGGRARRQELSGESALSRRAVGARPEANSRDPVAACSTRNAPRIISASPTLNTFAPGQPAGMAKTSPRKPT